MVFNQLQGVSYNFVPVQDTSKRDEDIIFDKNDNYNRYCHFKHLIILRKQKKVDKSEAQFNNEAKKIKIFESD